VTTDDSETPETISLEITDTLDLHSFRPHETADVLRSYLDEVYRLGIQNIRIIHGKGIGAQRKLVRTILSRDPRVVEISEPPENAGGSGATYASLAQPKA
jgi:dsDNA-specific endonuclease/ATPase MutS2